MNYEVTFSYTHTITGEKIKNHFEYEAESSLQVADMLDRFGNTPEVSDLKYHVKRKEVQCNE